MRRLVAILALALVALSAAPAAAVDTGADVREELLRVKRATRQFRDVAAAEAAGYVEFLDCFDSEAGGMGQHYVDLAALDTTVEATHPESIVYEIGADGSLTMVAVEYIVPNSPEVAADPPMLFDRHFHLNTDLDVWVLHAWVWKKNPTGMFEDYNPRVAACP
jgi:hypothetical protein